MPQLVPRTHHKSFPAEQVHSTFRSSSGYGLLFTTMHYLYIAFIAFFFKMVGHFLFCWCSFREMEASISFGLVMSLVSGLCVLLLLPCSAMAQPPRLAPASFVFGDSLADPGNNNYITTLSKANTPPNGIDFPGGKATGRYCNGRTTVDIVGKLTSL
jgi:hypothetical protein